MSLVFNRVIDRVAVETVGLIFFVMLAWPTYVSLRDSKRIRKRALTTNDEGIIKQQIPPHSLPSRAFTSHVQDKARFGIISAGINACLSRMKVDAQQYGEALGNALTQFVQEIESSITDEARWRPTLLPIMTKVENVFENRSQAYAFMVTLADRHDWSPWAVRCLPSLYGEINRTDYEIMAYVSRYVVASAPISLSYRIVDLLCAGEIVKLQTNEDTAYKIESIANTFCNYLRRDPSESDRAFLGTVVTVLSDEEIALRGTEGARRIRTQRMKILEDENVMLAA